MSSGLAYNGQDEVAPAPATPEFDIEKNKDGNAVTSSADSDSHDGVHFAADDRVKRTGVLWRITNKLSKYGVEERGIERIMPEERTQKSAWGCFWMWLAANCTISTFSLGTLGTSIWYMGFRDSALTILFFNLVFTIPVAFFSTFGPKTGMRQLTLARFSFGYWTVMIPVILNGIACIGWSTVNSIVGGQALRSVALHSDMKKIPVEVAIIIIAVCTVGFSFAGYKFVHTYEKYAWIPVVIVFIIYAAEIGPHVSATWGASGEAEASSVLSFGAAIVGFAIGWSSLAADYSCNLPEDTSSMKVFLLTYAGLNIPMITIEILGAAAMATFQNKTTWADAYSEEGVGGLLAAPLVGPIGGGGRFFTLILALSIVANNIPNLYSFALTAQVLGPWVQRIPRPFLTLFATVIYVILACVGAHNFETALDTLLLVLAYWLAIFITIVCEEHFIFRKGSFRNWNLDDVNNARKLPFGAAAFAALCCGWALAITFMSQTWFVGPGAALIGNPQYGTDLGFELAAAATAVTFPLFRWYEKKKWGY